MNVYSQALPFWHQHGVFRLSEAGANVVTSLGKAIADRSDQSIMGDVKLLDRHMCNYMMPVDTATGESPCHLHTLTLPYLF